MSKLNHIDIGDIGKTQFLKGSISSLPVNQNDDLATVSLSGGPVSCGFLFHPFWDFGERVNETPKGASGAFFEGDPVWVLKRDSDYRIVSLQNPSPTKQRLSFNMTFLDVDSNQLPGPPSWNDPIDIYIYENPGFILLQSAVWNGSAYALDGEGNPTAEYDAAKALWKVYLPNNYTPSPGVTNFVLVAEKNNTKVLYPDHFEPDGGFTSAEYDAVDAQIHPGRYEMTLEEESYSFTASFPSTATRSFIVDGQTPWGADILRGYRLEATQSEEWSIDVLVTYRTANSGAKTAFDEGVNIASVGVDYVDEFGHTSLQAVNVRGITFSGDAQAGPSGSNAYDVVPAFGPGLPWWEMRHDGPNSLEIFNPSEGQNTTHYPTQIAWDAEYIPGSITGVAPFTNPGGIT